MCCVCTPLACPPSPGSQRLLTALTVCRARQNAPPDDPFPTTGDDLQGFWDMVLIQVHHIDAMMDELEAIRANNWQLPEVRLESAAPASQQMVTAKLTLVHGERHAGAKRKLR